MTPHWLSPVQRTCALGAAAGVAVIGAAFLIDRFAPPDHLAEFPPLKPRVTPEQRLVVGTPDGLSRVFNEAGYDLDAVRAGKIKVPHLLLREWPDGFDEMKRTRRKKDLFVRTLLPLILHVNQTVLAQRATLNQLIRDKQMGEKLSHRERSWLKRLAKLYRTKPDNISVLLVRVAPIPPSLALAQAAIETGWGTSRFTRSGNALFGQWTYDAKKGLRPLRAGAEARHAVKVYDRLLESAWDYARNLNTHLAYRALRLARAAGVENGQGLADRLDRYSEQGRTYVRLIRNVIKQNRLARFDKATLAPRP